MIDSSKKRQQGFPEILTAGDFEPLKEKECLEGNNQKSLKEGQSVCGRGQTYPISVPSGRAERVRFPCRVSAPCSPPPPPGPSPVQVSETNAVRGQLALQIWSCWNSSGSAVIVQEGHLPSQSSPQGSPFRFVLCLLGFPDFVPPPPFRRGHFLFGIIQSSAAFRLTSTLFQENRFFPVGMFMVFIV